MFINALLSRQPTRRDGNNLIFAGFTIEEVQLNYRLSGKVTPARELIISGR